MGGWESSTAVVQVAKIAGWACPALEGLGKRRTTGGFPRDTHSSSGG